MFSFEHIWDVLGFLLAFISGIALSLWRAFTVFNRISLVEQRVQTIENELSAIKNDMRRVEDRLIDKVDLIDEKLDKMLLKLASGKNGTI